MLSLQDICIEKIIDYFEVYHAIYSAMTKKERLKLHFQLLRRFYSVPIIKQLYEKRSLSEDYVEFLINKYLTKLDTRWLSNCSWNVIIKKMGEIGHGLENVSFHKSELSWDKAVCYFPNMKCLFFQKHCDDNFLNSIAEFCPNIETIDVSFSDVSENGIKHLCCDKSGTVPCPMLKEVSVMATNVGDDGVKYLLKKLPSVEDIHYERLHQVVYSLHDINYLYKVKTYSLTTLDILPLISDSENEEYMYIFDDILKICLTVCPRLKVLQCGVTKQEHLKLCSRLSQLESLYIEGLNENSVDINDFLKERGYQLQDLYLNNVSMTASTLVQNCPHLKRLHMKKIIFLSDNNSMFVQHDLVSIDFESLSLTNFETSHSVARLLTFFPNLKCIHFWVCDMPTTEIETQIIKSCKQCTLKIISFYDSVVEPKLLEDILLTSSSLESLDIEDCSLVSMDLAESRPEMRVVAEQLESIASSLPNKPKIVHSFNN